LSVITRRILLILFAASIVGSIVGLVAQGHLLMMLPRLLALTAVGLGVILWVRPRTDSDMVRKAEISGYLEGITHRADVIQLHERRARDDVERKLGTASPLQIVDGG